MNLFNRVLASQWCWCPTKCWYVRVYPNPGFGFPLWGHKHRVAVSLWRGVEVFHSHPRILWAIKHRWMNIKLRKK